MGDAAERHREPGPMTDLGAHRSAAKALPSDLDALVAVVQGLLVHEHLAEAYGITISDEARAAVHERRAEAIVDRIVALDPAPLDVSRPPERRVVANCRQISVLLTAVLRAQGQAARARCGFGAYFVTGSYEDHWVVERWDEGAGRWALVDAQLDALQRDLFGVDFPITDVPRDRFVVAGDAWTMTRAGEADADRFGLSLIGEGGPFWIAGNLVRDASSLAGLEMLPWDGWGAMWEPGGAVDDERLAFLDRLADLTSDPDPHGDELARLAAEDDQLRDPGVVHNALRGVDEPVRGIGPSGRDRSGPTPSGRRTTGPAGVW